MRSTHLSCVLLSTLFAAGCVSTPAFGPAPSRDVMLVPADGRIEIGLDARGQITEVEYHCKEDDVPEAVLRAVEAVVPGGRFAGFEKEYHGSEMFYDVSKVVDGRTVDIMVTPTGRVRGREVEVVASNVPELVLENAAKGVPGSSRTGIEEVRDAGNTLVAYQVKSNRSGIDYKCVLTPDGEVVRVLRETLAEIEIPLRR